MGDRIINKNLKVMRYFDKRNVGSIPRIFLSSLMVIFFFSSMPQIINFFNNEVMMKNLTNSIKYINSKGLRSERRKECMLSKQALLDNS